MKAVGDRVNVSKKVLSMDYDSHSQKEKMEQRRDCVERPISDAIVSANFRDMMLILALFSEH